MLRRRCVGGEVWDCGKGEEEEEEEEQEDGGVGG